MLYTLFVEIYITHPIVLSTCCVSGSNMDFIHCNLFVGPIDIGYTTTVQLVCKQKYPISMVGPETWIRSTPHDLSPINCAGKTFVKEKVQFIVRTVTVLPLKELFLLHQHGMTC